MKIAKGCAVWIGIDSCRLREPPFCSHPERLPTGFPKPNWRLGVSPDLAALLHIGEECLVKRRRGSESLRLRWVPAKDEQHSRIRIVGCVGLI